MLLLAVEYLGFVFVAALGVLQWVAVRRGLRGLWLFPHPLACRLFALVGIAGSYSWFFLRKDRIRPGLEGFQQLFLFSLASLVAVAVTLALSSLRSGRRGSPSQEVGLEALRQGSYLQALRRGRDKGG